MLVGEVMTRDVAVVGPLTQVDEALHLLVARRVTSLPVVDDGAVVGILSEADLLGHLLSRDPRAHLIPVRPRGEDPPRLVEDLMTLRARHPARRGRERPGCRHGPPRLEERAGRRRGTSRWWGR